MPARNNANSTKNILTIILEGDNLVRVASFLFALSTFCFGIGFYFGKQNEEYQHVNEINTLNFTHLKELNDQKEKLRAAEDKLNQQKVDNLESSITLLERRLDEKH